jgi:hypothetical protein
MRAEDQEERLSVGDGVELREQAGDCGPVDGDAPERASRRLPQEELRALEDRARNRLSDPDFQRRLSATDRLARALIAERNQ